MRESVVVRVPEFPGTRNRDKDKLFRLTEWPAAKAENWGLRMMLAANSGAGELPLNLSGIGLDGIAILGINTFLRGNIAPGTLIPLLDELLQCVRYIRDQSKPHLDSDLVSDDDVEEVATRMWLRGEVLSLHLNFSVSAALSALYKKIMIPLPTESSSQRTSPGESTLQ
jgi:hypothetical protein